jgi:hypothetical protein
MDGDLLARLMGREAEDGVARGPFQAPRSERRVVLTI